MPKVFATPKEGVLVRHETGKQLEAAGEAVERNSYWLRRERDGDVTLGEVPEAAAEVAPEAASGSTATTKKK